MPLTTAIKQFLNKEWMTQFSSRFHTAVHDYLQGMDENDANKMRAARDIIKELYAEELKKVHPGIEEDIKSQQNENYYQLQGSHFFLSTVNYYQDINCVAIDENTFNVTIVKVTLVDSSAYEKGTKQSDANTVEFQRKHLFATICWYLEGKEGDSHSDMIAPNGCYYSENDVKYLTSNGYSYTQAINTLATGERYKKLSSELSAKLSQLGISAKSTFEELSKATEQLGGKVTSEGTQTYYYNTSSGGYGWKNPTLEQLQEATATAITGGPRHDIKMYDNENSQVGSPLESSVIKMTGTDGGKVYRENDYVQWLLENFNYIARNKDDGAPPQIPTSIGVSIAMVRTGNSVDRIGEYNFWLFPYDESLTDMPPKSNVCTFRTETNGLTAICVALHQDKYKQAIATLKEHMWDCSEEDKVVAARAILMVLDSSNADEQAKKALEFVTKYKMRDWDTDKKELEGGHADTVPNSSSAAKNIQSDIASAVKHFTNAQNDKGIGVLVTPIGSNYVKVTKLPVGKTYCEPIYPDYRAKG